MPGKHKGRKRALGEIDPDYVPGETTKQTQLNNSIQKIVKRSLGRGELSYMVNEVIGGFQAQIRVPEMGPSYPAKTVASEVMMTDLDARENASQLALDSIMSNPELVAIHDAPRPEKERPPIDPNADPDAPRHKSKLRNTVLKIFRGNLSKEDTVFETVQNGAIFTSTVNIRVLPGEWAQRTWTGSGPDENLAEQAAAEVALNDIMADDDLMAIHDRKTPRSGGSGGGYGKGKGKGKARTSIGLNWTLSP